MCNFAFEYIYTIYICIVISISNYPTGKSNWTRENEQRYTHLRRAYMCVKDKRGWNIIESSCSEGLLLRWNTWSNCGKFNSRIQNQLKYVATYFSRLKKKVKKIKNRRKKK